MHDVRLVRERLDDLREAMRRRGALEALGPQLDRCEGLAQLVGAETLLRQGDVRIVSARNLDLDLGQVLLVLPEFVDAGDAEADARDLATAE